MLRRNPEVFAESETTPSEPEAEVVYGAEAGYDFGGERRAS